MVSISFAASSNNILTINDVTNTVRNYLINNNTSTTPAIFHADISSNVTEIGYGAFFNNLNITSVYFPISIHTIDVNAFIACKNLQHVIWEDSTSPNMSLEIIKQGAFNGCRSLSSIVIPYSVTTIGDYAFWGTTLSTVTINYSLHKYVQNPAPIFSSLVPIQFDYTYRFLFKTSNGDDNTLTQDDVTNTLNGYDGSFNAVIDSSITNIDDYAFSNSGITSIDLGDSVTSIGKEAFVYCTSLTSIDLSGTQITTIGDSAFQECQQLSNVTFDTDTNSKLKTIGSSTFWGCTSLTSIHIPDSVETIGPSAFRQCYGLTIVSLPNNTNFKTIGPVTFYYCSQLTSINIPSSITTIGIQSFRFCSKLQYININNDNDSGNNKLVIQDDAFQYITSDTNKPIVYLHSTLQNEYANSAYFSSLDSITFTNRPIVYLTSSNQSNSLTSIDVSYALNGYDGSFNAVIDSSITDISDNAFSEYYTLTNIFLPNTITNIGSYAFKYCTNLTSIAIPDSVTNIGYGAFQNCSNLTSIDLSKTRVTDIAAYAFFECFSLTSITIPESVTTIGSSAFLQCTSLTSIDLLVTQVTSIGLNAFNGCNSLSSIHFPYSVITIGNSAFFQCTSLTSIDLLVTQVTSIGLSAFNGCNSLSSIHFPYSVITIGNSAFFQCTSLTSVTLPTNPLFTTIGSNVFGYCSKITSLTIPESVTNIGLGAFTSTDLSNVTMNLSLKNIYDNDTYFSNSNGTNINYNYTFGTLLFQPSASNGTTLTQQDVSNALYGFSGPFNALINDSVITIGPDAFANSTLYSIDIPISITTIGSSAFENCYSLISIDLSGTQVETIGSYAFQYCTNLTSITIPDSVTSIGQNAFQYCTSLTSITIPDSVRTIGDYAFSRCSGLTSISLDASNISFSDISGVLFNKDQSTLIQYPLGNTANSYTIPDSVTTIESGSFTQGSSLTSITIPDSVTTIGQGAFTSTNLSTVTMSLSLKNIYDNDTYFSNSNGNGTNINYNYTFGTLLFQPSSGTTLTQEDVSNALSGHDGSFNVLIDESVTNIGENAFTENHTLLSVDFQDNSQLITIGSSAFRNCTSLTSIDLPVNDTFTSINTDALSGCTNLTSITIPGSVTNIGENAFRGSFNITSITIPNSIETIGSLAFYNCSSLTSINLPINVNFTILSSGLFQSCSSLTSITIPDSVTTIGDFAFHNCSSLTIINIPGSVTNIGTNTFSGISESVTVWVYGTITTTIQNAFPDIILNAWNFTVNADGDATIGTGVSSSATTLGTSLSGAIIIPSRVSDQNGNYTVIGIEQYAFSFCNQLTIINIPDSVKDIGRYAFGSCSSLSLITVDANNNSFCDINGVLFNKDQNTLIRYPQGKTATSYAIPDSVTSIGPNAFGYCFRLTSIDLPNSVTTIGQNAFESCTGLTSIDLGNSLTTIDLGVFSFCSGLTSITIPDSVTTIGQSAFNKCNQLTSIIILNSDISTIGDYAFSHIDSNAVIHLYESVYNDFSANSFGSNSDITFEFEPINITLNTSSSDIDISNISSSLHIDCSSIHTITYDLSNSDTDFFSISGDKLDISHNIYSQSPLIDASYVITIKATNSYGLYSYNDFTIKFPVTVYRLFATGVSGPQLKTYAETLGITNQQLHAAGYTFNQLDDAGFQLWNYTLDASNNASIGDGTGNYGNATTLGTDLSGVITIPSTIDGYTVTSIEPYAFSNSGITSITIPDSVETIGSNAFLNCSGLTSVTLPTNPLFTSIVSGAFYKCSSLTSIDLGNSVTTIGSNAFSQCTSLTSITIPDSVETIDSQAFYGCSSLTSIDLSGTQVTTIYYRVFGSCSSLTSITIPDSVTNISQEAFFQCSNLTSIVIPDSVTTIGSSAFRRTGLTSIVILNSDISTIGSDAFESIYYSAVIHLYESVYNDFSANSFGNVNHFEFEPQNITLNNSNDIIIDISDKISLLNIDCSSSDTVTYNLSNNHTDHFSISDDKLNISDNIYTREPLIDASYGITITATDSYGFYSSNHFLLNFPITTTAQEAIIDVGTGNMFFSGTEYEIFSGLQNWANYYDVSIIDLSSAGFSVDYLRQGTYSATQLKFAGYNAIQLLDGGYTISQLYHASYNVSDLIGLYTYTYDSLRSVGYTNQDFLYSGKYRDANNRIWYFTYNSPLTIGGSGEFTITDLLGNEIKPSGELIIPSSIYGIDITGIGNNAFADCSELSAVTIPYSVTNIGNHAFKGASGLTKITLSPNITSIGDGAFQNCDNLTEVELYYTMTSYANATYFSTSQSRGSSQITFSFYPCKLTGCDSCGGPNPPNLWPREIPACPSSDFTSEQLNERRKAEILKYKKNSSGFSQKQQYSRLARGLGKHRHVTYATQSQTYTNANIKQLPFALDDSGTNILVCPNSSVLCATTSQNDVPGPVKTLCLDSNVPLYNYIVQRTYGTSGNKWPQYGPNPPGI